jgi:beta-lactamase superfamily II metal-dependent hydrolase
MTIISVGDNAHGHPDKKSIEFYEKHSSGASNGDKVYRTDKNGNILLTLKDGGGWSIQKEK